ncbi:MAG: hypothetical protein FWD82_04365 [Defluviitaleaceae bacterium]|nr:hypothetical protein [Defluviitaleaceae bacterium]
MENYCPEALSKRELKLDKFCDIIDYLLNKYYFQKVVLTGGEPLLSNEIEVICKTIKNYEIRLELNTNGSLFNENQMRGLIGYFDEVKISLDTLNSRLYGELSGTDLNYIPSVYDFISFVNDRNKGLTINTVYCKITEDSTKELIEYADKEEVNINIMDLYYTDETKMFWKRNFMPIQNLINEFEDIYQVKTKEKKDIFGCKFNTYINKNEKYIQFKSSDSGTMRDNVCDNCIEYCQEGVYSIKLSRQGWLTACQSNNIHGVDMVLNKDDSSQVVERVLNCRCDQNSFTKLKERIYY